MSNKLVCLWKQLEFWFSKKPQGFYKFIKPCAHRLYRAGDSWCEQLSLSENTFRKYLSPLCVTYTSKKAFISQHDPFQGKPYACYFDRLKKLTFYFRNPVVADGLSAQKILSLFCASDCVWSYTDLNKDFNNPPKSPLKLIKPNREGGRVISSKKKQNPHKLSASIPPMAQQMYEIWKTATQDHITTPPLTPHFASKLMQALQTFFGNCLAQWKAYCQKITSSSFLMGKNSSFQAWLIWIIRGDVVQKVQEGAYGIASDKIEPSAIVDEVSCENKSQEILLSAPQETFVQKTLQALKQAIGAPAFASWFDNITFQLDGEGRGIQLGNVSVFHKEQLLNRFSLLLRKYCIEV